MSVSSFQVSVSLLVLSLAGNGYLLLRAEPPAPTPPPPVDSEAREDPALPACTAKLEACQRAASGMAKTIWESALQQGPSAAAAAPPPKSGKPAEPGAAAAVCKVAREKLREQWLEKRDLISLGLGHDLADVPKQRADAERDAAHAAEAIGVDPRAHPGFEKDFADLRAKQVADLAPLAATPAVDWPRMLDGAKSSFEGEDSLVQRELGPEALARYRESQTDRRVTILTMVATYAGADWDDVITSP